MGEASDRPLTVITGDRKTRERRAERRRALDQNEQITCWRCENEIGIATSMAVRVILAPRRTPLARLVITVWREVRVLPASHRGFAEIFADMVGFDP